MTTPLSPAAQAVLDAAYALPLKNGQPHLAAVLRVAANEVAPFEAEDINGCWYEKRNPVREQLLAIATELEAYDDDVSDRLLAIATELEAL